MRLHFEPSFTNSAELMSSMPPEQFQAVVDEALTSRRSIRAFTAEPVDQQTISQILEVASRAPSGTNTQPWQVHVLTGDVRDKLVNAIQAVFSDPQEAAKHRAPHPYYPKDWKPHFLERRRKVGWDLYGLLGLTRENKAGMHAQHARNYQFFDAPVGLIFTIDKSLEIGSWLDYGMFLQAVMTAARGHGLDTCPQAAFTQFHQIIASELDLDEDETVVCGMALGYADNDAIENSLQTERAPVAKFATFRGF